MSVTHLKQHFLQRCFYLFLSFLNTYEKCANIGTSSYLNTSIIRFL